MEPIVFVPGLLCTEILYAPQLAAFGDRPLMVADHRGHETMAKIAAAILVQAPERFALVGLSMGGYVAMEIMRQAADRVSRLALLDTAARADTPEQTARRETLVGITKKGQFNRIVPLLHPSLVHPDRVADADLRGATEEMARDTGPEAFLRQQAAIIARPDSRASLANVTCPALVLVGDADALTPPERAQEMHAIIPGSRLEVVPHCGHLSTLERPEVVTSALRGWLDA
ncbi:alpha/beta fold hydrolase [Breoghania sp. L-A4]|uniref:alpha/beta fold hydrolase n=1 Tax=Breoghania sp. L-A4 TaxID=2304600 RepID=UPI000E358F5C|nr:alpha/beta fold hydrolase [Breoghania sp. L-A4]AXS42024.1 alpha/beta fold hydrolase [Breoghania sp. L-A4]